MLKRLRVNNKKCGDVAIQCFKTAKASTYLGKLILQFMHLMFVSSEKEFSIKGTVYYHYILEMFECMLISKVVICVSGIICNQA